MTRIAPTVPRNIRIIGARMSRLTGTIGSKLGWSFGIVVLLLLGLSGVAYWGLAGMTSLSDSSTTRSHRA